MTRLTMEEVVQDGVSVLNLKGRINTVTAGDFKAGLASVIARPTIGKVIDFTNVNYMSSGGFRHLISAADETHTLFVLCGLSKEMRFLFQTCGLLNFFEICSDRAEAIAHINQAARAAA